MPEIIYELIEEYFQLETGDLISVFQEEILIYNNDVKLKIRRRSLKHIVEKRKLDNYDLSKIKNFFVILGRILEEKHFIIVKDKMDDLKSFLLLQTDYTDDVGVVLALELVIEENDTYFIKTAFFRSITKISKIIKTKISLAG